MVLRLLGTRLLPGIYTVTEPRWLDRDAAARYLCVRPAALARLVREGRIAPPVFPLGPRSPRWDRARLDASMAGAGPGAGADPVAQAVREILAARPRRSA